MKFAKDGVRFDASGPLNQASDRGGVACHRAIRSHIDCANSGRIAPSIRQDLISDRDKDRQR